MLRPRIIACLLLSNGGLVKTVRFAEPKYVGDPLNAVRIFNEKQTDELIVLDIDATANRAEPNFRLIAQLAAECRMPLCYGGGVKSVEQARRIIGLGVEKVAISSAALSDPDLVASVAAEVGRQSVVVVLDAKWSIGSRQYEVWTHNGKRNTGRPADVVAKEMENLGAGEIVINSIDNDGRMLGYDLNLAKSIRTAVRIQMTVLGGAGKLSDISELFNACGVLGASAGSLFIFKGPYRAVLINYPTPTEKDELIAATVQPPAVRRAAEDEKARHPMAIADSSNSLVGTPGGNQQIGTVRVQQASWSVPGTQHGVRKILSYLRLYGPGRLLFKIAGRLRWPGFGHLLLARRRFGDVAVIGCGQFAFATIGYHLTRRFGRRFYGCYDIASDKAQSFGAFYRVEPFASAEDLISSPQVRYVYIASNHASHSDYAIAALRAGKIVYVEKPVAVTHAQSAELSAAVALTGGRIYAGYNRPFSQAVSDLRKYCRHTQGPLSLSCFIAGHKLAEDHWYRNPQEGTRICGNVGHWLDLAVHILCWNSLPGRWSIALTWSDSRARDEDLNISLVSERGDLVSIVLTARSEPFEGINETINFQWGDVIAKIDDFRCLEVWQGARRWKRTYWPKDVGHRGAILQPFSDDLGRWGEVELSTGLMLHIAEMVRSERRLGEFEFGRVDRPTLHEATDARGERSVAGMLR